MSVDPAALLADALRGLAHAAGLAALLARAPRPLVGPRFFDTPTRRRILEILARRRAIRPADLVSLLRCGWSSMTHHVERLAEAGFLKVETRHGRRIIAAANADPDEVAKVTLLRLPSMQSVAEAILQHPGLPIARIREIAGVSRKTAYQHVKALADAGLLELRPHRSYFDLRAKPELENLLRKAKGE